MFNFFGKKNPPTSPPPAAGPDFSKVDRAKAEEMFRSGKLEKMMLLPQEFGGDDRPENVLYVPAAIAKVKTDIDKTVIAPMLAQGQISQYSATPEYQGESFIPISINITAWNPGQFVTTVIVWGEAFTRNKK